MNRPSLLPYLTGAGGGFFLELSPCGKGPDGRTDPRFPYEVVSDASGLTRILGARMVSDGGGEVLRVFLLVSRDEYPLEEQGAGHLSNPDIEAAWERAFRGHLGTGAVIPLAAQTGPAGSPAALNPLFVCVHAGRFFHPSCPRCGTELDLVRDDSVLAAAGLRPYTTTLRRYLDCPACRGTQDAAFYAFRPDGDDPACVQDPSGIVRGIAVPGTEAAPCAGCPERQPCHGSGLVMSRISPVAFYPFHLLMSEAATLNAADFLALVSGAPVKDLETALDARRRFTRRALVGRFRERTADTLLFMEDERRFPEVLYLKLSFLGEVAGRVLENPEDHAWPGFGPSPESLWVRISEQSPRLPALWGFRPALMDLDPQVPDVLPGHSAGHAVRAMGVLWFRALMGNPAVDARDVDEALRGIVREKHLGANSPVLAPENALWDGAVMPARWRPFWERACRLGASLLLEEDASGFRQTCRELLDALKRELFTGAPAGEPSAEAHSERIGSIVRAVRQRWATAVDGPEPAGTPAPPPAAGDLDATVVMPGTDAPPAPAPQDDFSRTVVMDAPPAGEELTAAVPDDFSTETVIMHHAPASPEPPREQPSPDETVVMGAPPGAVRQPPAEPAPKADEDALAETVIIRPEKT